MRNKIDELFDSLLGEEESVRNWDRDDLWEVGGPVDFERLVADLWEHMGYDTTRTAISGDDGVDVIAEQPGRLRLNTEVVVVQEEQYRGNVGANAVRNLAGAKSMHDADMAVLVTSSNFTANAERTAEQVDVELVPGGDLKHRLNQSDIEPPELEYL